ncbi:MAG TPA: BTAD domain-containing putative transcriptional regulator, partial [Actinomycetota bacterium]|nr:BTAD domain-containing putative transcriptional regulator [Actinomycetota bacterium]
MRGRRTDIQLLGRFAVFVDGQEVPPGAFAGRLVRTLIRLLLTRRGSAVPREVIVEALWPGRPPMDPGANVDVLVSRARRALQDPGLLIAVSGGLCFVGAEGCRVDAETFVARVRAGQEAAASGAWAMAHGEFQAALDSWAGEPLPEDIYADWAQGYRRELLRAHQDALEGAAEAALACGQAGRAVVFAEHAVAQEPLRERASVLLAKALAASADQAGALGTLRVLRERLAGELGVDPSAGVADLELGLLRAGVASPEAQEARVPRIGAGATTAGTRLRLVGRSEELTALLGFLDTPGVVAQVVGPAGSGKSRLLAEVQPRLGRPSLAVRAFLPEVEEPWSLARALIAEALTFDVTAARALPLRMQSALSEAMPTLGELEVAPAAAVSAENQRALVQEAAVRILRSAAGPDSVVLIDDLQWADPTSATLLSLLIRRVPEARWVLAYRPEELRPGEILGRILGGPTARRVTLGPLTPAGVGDLARDPVLAQLLVGETDGSPFTLAEALRSLAEEGLVVVAPEGRWSLRSATGVEQARAVVIGGQRRSILGRVAALAPRRRTLLVLLALLGREAPAALLAEAAGQPQGTVLDDLDALAQAGLVRSGEGGWAASHDLIAESIGQSLSPGEAAQLHGALGRALGGREAGSAERAAHLRAAGQVGAAVEAFATAGRAALRRHAVDEADSLASSGLALAGAHPERNELLGIRAEARAHRGDLAGARRDLTQAIAASSGPERALRMARLAMLTSGATDLVRASDLVDQALLEARDDPRSRAEALYVGAVVDMNAGATERAGRRYDEALALYEQAGDGLGVANVLDGRAMAAVMEGRIAAGAEALRRVARLFADSGELARAIWPLGARGAALGWMLRGEEGLGDVAEALELARELGHPEGEAYCRLEESLVMASLGRADEAQSAAEEALERAESLGHAEWTAGALVALGGAR